MRDFIYIDYYQIRLRNIRNLDFFLYLDGVHLLLNKMLYLIHIFKGFLCSQLWCMLFLGAITRMRCAGHSHLKRQILLRILILDFRWIYFDPFMQGWVEWITYLPGLLCIAGNIFFFLNIFYILITKLRAPHANEPTNFRKAVRACSVLVPLFGLQWLLTFYRFFIYYILKTYYFFIRFNSGSCYLLAAYKYTDLLLD